MGRCVGFVGSRRLLKKVADILILLGYSVNPIHGDDDAFTVDETGQILTMAEKKAS
jgi:hypothetical protein